MESNYRNSLYKDYEKEVDKNQLLAKENKYFKLESSLANDEKNQNSRSFI